MQNTTRLPMQTACPGLPLAPRSTSTPQAFVARAAALLLVAVFCSMLAAVPGRAFAASPAPDYSWYKGHEQDQSYQLDSAADLQGLAHLVNGTYAPGQLGVSQATPLSFAGKTIVLAGSGAINYGGADATPIGTKDTPFLGRFDGSGRQIDNFRIVSTSGPSSNLGFIGYAGEGAAISNLSIGGRASLRVERDAASNALIENVGLVAGYCGGTISNCSNAGSVTVVSAAKQQSKDQYWCVGNVGGVAGTCVYDMTGCTNTGRVSVEATASPVSDYNDRATMARNIAGVVGILGDSSRMGTKDDIVPSDASKHGSIAQCTNTGKVYVNTPAESGVDRFGVQVFASCANVAGVVGYSQGSVVNCINGIERATSALQIIREVGYVRAEAADPAGGVCGSLRGTPSDNYSVGKGDNGTAADVIEMRGCVNYGDVYGRAAVGGVVGHAGSYTKVTGCLNLYKQDVSGNRVPTYIVGTRWNKPGTAGIASRTYGEVSYCANFGTILSGTWNDEDARTYTLAGGYYVSGVVGFTLFYSDKDNNYQRTTPIPEVYGCYNAGPVQAQSGMRQRGITGSNDGYTHDNILLAGTVENDNAVYGDESGENEASGTVSNNIVMTAAQLRGATDPIKQLNTNGDASGWNPYWVANTNATSNGANNGYPVLSDQNAWNRIDIAQATASLKANAPYTGFESIPELEVKLGSTTLLQGVDFIVVPQAGAVDVSSGPAYRAGIQGIGKYTGSKAGACAYGIGQGDMASCSVLANVKTFNFSPQTPSASEVEVTTPAGTVVDPSEYTFEVLDADGNPFAPTDTGAYTLRVSAKPSSVHFSGSVDGEFRIKTASLMSDVEYSTISYLGTDYPWVDSSKVKNEATNPQTTLPYTGVAVQPTVGPITYQGRTLVEGVDYRVIYGNSNSDDENVATADGENLGVEGGTSVGCVTVRYITQIGSPTNFSSYSNMFFKITDTGAASDLSKASFEAPNQIYDGQPWTQVTLRFGAKELVEGTDYTIEFSDNVNVGTARFTATGIGRFTGSLSGTFAITEGQLYGLQYRFDDDGSAQVIGVIIEGGREAVDIEIPETVEANGRTYTVRSIADNAFGGGGSSDFVGSPMNEAKHKVRSVSVPATVRSIGSFAFGTGVTKDSGSIESITFAPASQLESIADNAFAQCAHLEQVSIPASVSTIGAGAFGNCTALHTVTFETTDAAQPAAIATGTTKGAFAGCNGVTVRALAAAQAARAVAEQNAGAARGTHGGTRFVFEALQGTLADAVIDAVGDQTYTGQPITPALTVRLADKVLTEGADYLVSFADNIEVGTATATLTGIGSYFGQAQASFAIVLPDSGWVRIAGDNRYFTMAGIVEASYASSPYAVVATGSNFPDALSASALAGAYQCPVVLTKKTGLSDQARAQLERLGVTNVIVMGGEAAVPALVQQQIEQVGQGIAVVRAAGSNRQATSLEAFKAFQQAKGSTGYDTVVVASGKKFPDSLSIGPYSFAYGAPVLLVNGKGVLTDEEVAAIKADANIANVVVVGGAAVVDYDAVRAQLGDYSYTLLAGANRYQTSREIANWELAQGMTVALPAVATGKNFPDALAGAPLCGVRNSVLVLAAPGKMEAVEVLASHKADIIQGSFLGGTAAVPEDLARAIEESTRR